MLNRSTSRTMRLTAAGSIAALAALAFTGCSGSGSGSDKVGVALIVEDHDEPVLRRDGGRARRPTRPKRGVNLTVASGKQDGDVGTPRSRRSRDSIARGDKGILITPNGPGVQNAIDEGPRRRSLRHRARHARPTRRRPSTSHSPPTTSPPAKTSASGPQRSSTASRPTSPCSTCSTTRSSRSTTTATRAS